MDYYKGTIPILDDAPDTRDLAHPKGVGYGYVPRDYRLYPQEMFDHPDEMTLIPESEWDARYDEQESQQSSLEHLYLAGGKPAFVNLDQAQEGYCWGYSTGHGVMFDRLKSNQPPIRINPHATCAIIKGGRNEGGWCGLSAKFGREVGWAVEGTGPGQWPLHSRNLKYDTPELRASMALHKASEEWADLTRQVYDQNLTTRQIATCGFTNTPTAQDFNHWSHSVCGIRWVRIERGDWGPLILNSWKDWGRFGLGVLRGSKAICDGAVALRVTGASPT